MQKPAEGNFRGHAFMQLGVSLDPGFDLGLGQALDGLLGVGGLGAAAAVHEVEAVGGLVEGLLIAGGITKSAHGVLFHQSGGLGVVFLLDIGNMDKLVMYAALLFAVQLLIRLVYGLYCSRHFEETRLYRHFNVRLFREMTAFAGWNIWGSLAGTFMTQGLNLLLNMF